jgi:hypothetical protein
MFFGFYMRRNSGYRNLFPILISCKHEIIEIKTWARMPGMMKENAGIDRTERRLLCQIRRIHRRRRPNQPTTPSPSGLTSRTGDEEPPEQVPESNEAIRAAGERARSTMTRMYEMLDQARDGERE